MTRLVCSMMALASLAKKYSTATPASPSIVIVSLVEIFNFDMTYSASPVHLFVLSHSLISMLMLFKPPVCDGFAAKIQVKSLLSIVS